MRGEAQIAFQSNREIFEILTACSQADIAWNNGDEPFEYEIRQSTGTLVSTWDSYRERYVLTVSTYTDDNAEWWSPKRSPIPKFRL